MNIYILRTTGNTAVLMYFSVEAMMAELEAEQRFRYFNQNANYVTLNSLLIHFLFNNL